MKKRLVAVLLCMLMLVLLTPATFAYVNTRNGNFIEDNYYPDYTQETAVTTTTAAAEVAPQTADMSLSLSALSLIVLCSGAVVAFALKKRAQA